MLNVKSDHAHCGVRAVMGSGLAILVLLMSSAATGTGHGASQLHYTSPLTPTIFPDTGLHRAEATEHTANDTKSWSWAGFACQWWLITY